MGKFSKLHPRLLLASIACPKASTALEFRLNDLAIASARWRREEMNLSTWIRSRSTSEIPKTIKRSRYSRFSFSPKTKRASPWGPDLEALHLDRRGPGPVPDLKVPHLYLYRRTVVASKSRYHFHPLRSADEIHPLKRGKIPPSKKMDQEGELPKASPSPPKSFE